MVIIAADWMAPRTIPVWYGGKLRDFFGAHAEIDNREKGDVGCFGLHGVHPFDTYFVRCPCSPSLPFDPTHATLRRSTVHFPWSHLRIDQSDPGFPRISWASPCHPPFLPSPRGSAFTVHLPSCLRTSLFLTRYDRDRRSVAFFVAPYRSSFESLVVIVISCYFTTILVSLGLRKTIFSLIPLVRTLM